jgi:hypothetical protein
MDKVNSNRFRRARLKNFLDGLSNARNGKPSLRVIDVGGTSSYWLAMRDLWQSYGLEITIVNLDAVEHDDGPLRIRAGNACAMPEYADLSFDVVHSNSVIEHVGHWPEMMAMAHEIPYEPHYRTPLFQYLPESTRANMLLRRRHGFRGPYGSLDEAMRDVQSVSLLSRRQLSALFPDASIESESFVGLTKSLIARR